MLNLNFTLISKVNYHTLIKRDKATKGYSHKTIKLDWSIKVYFHEIQ